MRRTRDSLERLLEDPHPLARLIATCALARCETRGVHCRVDWPNLDPALDRMHTIVAADGTARFARWD
jgi:L-aspartate oxidase